MGRRIPFADNNNHNLLLLIHPFLYYSFLAATLAASIVIISALCGVRSRKKPSSPPPSDHLHTTKHYDAGSPPTNESGNRSNEIPVPPAMQQQSKESGSTSNMRKANNSEHGSSFSLRKGPRNLSVSKSGDLKENGRKKEKLKAEESVWMKTIILGEKCVPDEEDNAVIYEGKGKKISAYHPRNSSSFSISKQLSSISQELSPDSSHQNDL
ncbi:hypothetical protein QN277_017765 [Acacia crassicarpa]|uniref:Uncharacterized protein n=1 Tax=Acacia crassicarpa TaxID=499986 RepID=A0AAE1KGM8_9FABA|nr:hypothetical protein QN277_017765 [Acacia crassicarpa]